MHPVQLFCWHFMAYPHLPADFDEKYDTAWITVPNKLWDGEKSQGLYQEYIDQLAYAARIGFSPPYFHHRKLIDRLGRYGNPALVLHGALDHMVPGAHAEAYAAGLGDARLEIMDKAGHSPHQEAPEDAAALVTEFLDG